MNRMWALLCPLLCLLALPAAASAATTVMVFDGAVNVLGSGAAMDVVADAPAPSTIRVVSFSGDDNLIAGAGCAEAPAETVTCAGLTPAEFDLVAYGSALGDAIAVDPAATFPAELYGGGGGDVLLGGGGNDRLAGGFGADELDGREGSDLVDNGLSDANLPTAADGADLYRDTGTAGEDSLNFGFQTVGVHLKVDGVANDGGSDGAEGDDVRGGFEKLRGTKLADAIIGGPAAEIINGSDGDDDITGGAGVDTIEGNEGVDTVRARDGVVDAVIDCDSASSVTQGAGETAIVDGDDPEPQRCELVDRGGGAPGPGPGPGAPGEPAAGGGAPSTPVITPLTLGPVNVTETVSRMPRVTGKKFAAARDEVLKVVAFAQVDLDFRRGCPKGDFLEVSKQTPLTGASLSNDVRSPAQVSFVVCIADADYLRDCDLAAVKTDVKALGNKALDADVALTVLGKVNRCKVDYDIKLSKAAEEARIKLEAQRASEALDKAKRDKENAKNLAQNKIKADLKASITCPIGGPLNVGLIDGYTTTSRALGFKKAAFPGDPDAWTLPSNSQADYQSFIEVVVTDRAAQFPEAKVFLDTDGVTAAAATGSKSVQTTRDGRAVFSVRPTKPGLIRVCAVVQTGADEVISTGLEIRVTPQPKQGTVYETQSGRRVKLTPDGPVAQKSALSGSEPQAQRLDLFSDLFSALVSLFSGRSQALTAQAGSGGEARVRTAAVAEKARAGVGQITLNGRLQPNPGLPTLKLDGLCLSSKPDGSIAQLRCPVLQAPAGAVLIGLSNSGTGVMALGHDNVIKAVPQNIVKAGTGTLIGLDGSTLIGNDGSTLIGNDGSTLIGNDGSTLIGNDGSTLIGNDGSTLIGNDGSTLLGATEPISLMPAPAQVIARDGAGLMSAAAGQVTPGGLT